MERKSRSRFLAFRSPRPAVSTIGSELGRSRAAIDRLEKARAIEVNSYGPGPWSLP